ncbi:RNA helicase aquarius [Eumeta japonica]|uniref:RNA helicase aquarius n=1 Tax=Eumeta variegata TaxID=151549 RepID=A0A4C1SPL0_EUMVA|nr:RNA helicase aquarius [Eumeta japonica]
MWYTPRAHKTRERDGGERDAVFRYGRRRGAPINVSHQNTTIGHPSGSSRVDTICVLVPITFGETIKAISLTAQPKSGPDPGGPLNPRDPGLKPKKPYGRSGPGLNHCFSGIFLLDFNSVLHTLDHVPAGVRCVFNPLVLLEMLRFYARFEINDETGDPRSDRDMTLIHYNQITSLQKAAFAKFSDLMPFALANVASVDTRETLQKHFGNLSEKALRAIATHLNLVPPEGKEGEAPWHRYDKSFLKELLISRHERRISQLEVEFNALYPTELYGTRTSCPRNIQRRVVWLCPN